MWVGPLAGDACSVGKLDDLFLWGHLAMTYVCGLCTLHGLFCCFVSVLLPLFGSEARMYSLGGGRKPYTPEFY